MRKRDKLRELWGKSPVKHVPSQSTPDHSALHTAPKEHTAVVTTNTATGNPALQLTIEPHLNALPEADKDAFRQPSTQITTESLLPAAMGTALRRDEAKEECGPSCPLKHIPKATIAPHKPSLRSIPPASDTQMREIARTLYQTLQPWQTRLIALCPGTPEEPLKCELLEADIIAAEGVGLRTQSVVVEYEAISYSWGRPLFETSIQCNGINFPITCHLADALRHFRYQDKQRYLWIDAFCINQYDDAEKSRQVQNMLLIFEKAKGVVAWLGLPQNTSIFVDFLSDELMPSDRTSLYRSSVPHDPQCVAILDQMAEESEEVRSRSWFRRTWVRQEVFAAKEINLHLGRHVFSFNKFTTIIEWLCKKIEDKDGEDYSFGASLKTIKLLQDSTRHSGADLSDDAERRALASRRGSFINHVMGILAPSTYFLTTDPRDRIYGALGMIFSPSAESRIRFFSHFSAKKYSVDYSKSVSQVYQDFVKFCIEYSGTLDILTFVQIRQWHLSESEPDSDRLPTWAIDWRHQTPRYLEGSGPLDWFQYPPQDHSDIFRYPGMLRLYGFQVGQITALPKATAQQVLKRYSLDPSSHSYSQLTFTEGYHTPGSTRSLRADQAMEQLSLECRHIAFSGGQLLTEWDSPITTEWALVSHLVDQGDLVVCLEGTESLVILRPCPGTDTFTIDTDEQEIRRFFFLGPAHLLNWEYKEAFNRHTSRGIGYTTISGGRASRRTGSSLDIFRPTWQPTPREREIFLLV
jgi:hypothetical protein